MRVAAPLAGALLVQMAMGVTDGVLLGRLGEAALAAGGLGGTVLMTVLIVLQGALTGVSVLVAQARGAGQEAAVPTIFWSGAVLAVALMAVAWGAMSLAGPVLLAAGQEAAVVREMAEYLRVLRWSIPGAMVGMGLMRAFLPAVGGGSLLLLVSVVEAVANLLLCIGLIDGRWGLPALGMLGVAAATAAVMTGSALILLAMVLGRHVGWARPRLPVLRALLGLGLPVAAAFAVESGLFLAVALLMGLLGPAALAAQQVAYNTVSLAFMVPLALAQAANVRVGDRVGAGDRGGARRAGLVAIGLGAGFELLAALAVTVWAGPIARLFLGTEAPEVVAIATGLLGVCVLFQVADGVQCVAGGALRGLGDTRVPFLLASLGYWGAGFPLAWWLSLRTGLGPAGAWWGLAAGLVVVAGLLLWRFDRRSRRGVGALALG